MALELKHLNDTGDFLTLAYKYGDDFPLRRILLAAEAADCKTVVIETNANDEEYNSEYQEFYINVHGAKPPSEVVRLHLFEDILENLEKDTLESKKESYIGYCTLRPTRKQKVSDAFVSKRIIIDEGSRFVYLLCAMDKVINLNGVDFKISGFPYMQQDGRISACAQTAIRIISQYLSWKNKSIKPLTGPAVTKLVRNIPSQLNQPLRTVPTSGLEVPQLRAAFDSLGSLNCDPIIYDYTFAKKEKVYIERADQIIYRYLESGLPVFVGIDMPESRHALVVIGHTFNPDYWMSKAASQYFNLPEVGQQQYKKGMKYHCSSSWVQNFIIQDDNFGPYYFVDSSFFQYATSCILVPLPNKVYLRGEHAEAQAYDFIYRFAVAGGILEDALSQLESSTQGRLNARWLKMFIDFRDKYDLILRSYLRKSSELKEELNKFTRSTEVRSEFSTIEMPEYVWVVEISWPDIFSHMRKKCGEIIIDATADEDEFYHSILAMHLPGFFYKKTPLEEPIYFKLIFEEDQPSRHLFRMKKPIPSKLPLGQFA